MEITFYCEGKQVAAEFNPKKQEWKSRNFGAYTPSGIYFPEIDKTVFVKRLPEPPLAHTFLEKHMKTPCGNSLPMVYAIHEEKSQRVGRGYYLFTEFVDGVSLDLLKDQLSITHCYEVLGGVYSALQDILSYDHWYGDLDISNVFVTTAGDGSISIKMIDIDSSMPSFTPMDRYLTNPHRRANVNERYWSYLVSQAGAERLGHINGTLLSQSAFMYFAVDLWFQVQHPEMSFSLKPEGLKRIMSPSNEQFFPEAAKKLWNAIHNRMILSAESEVGWRYMDRFVTMAYRFPRHFDGTPRNKPSGGVLDKLFKTIFG